jgi:hypothetical protein
MCDEDPGNRQVFGEESMSCTWVFEWHVRFRQTEKGDVKCKVKSMLMIFFDIKGIFHKEFALAYYCDHVKILPSILATALHLTLPFFTRESLTKNNITIVTLPFCFPNLR